MTLYRLLHFFGAHLGELFAALAGAMAGSFSAYWLQRGSEKRRKRAEYVAEIIKAQIVLTTQLNTLRNLWENNLKPLQDVPDRNAHLQLIRFFATGDPILDINAIAFLVTRKTPNITLHVHLAQRSYLNAIDALITRNRLYEELNLKSELVQLDGKIVTVKSDPRLPLLLEAATDNLFRVFPPAMERCATMIKELAKDGGERYYTWFSRRYGKRRFLKVNQPAGVG